MLISRYFRHLYTKLAYFSFLNQINACQDLQEKSISKLVLYTLNKCTKVIEIFYRLYHDCNKKVPTYVKTVKRCTGYFLSTVLWLSLLYHVKYIF